MQRRKEFGRFMKNMKSCEADVVTWRVGQAQDEASLLGKNVCHCRMKYSSDRSGEGQRDCIEHS